MAAAGIDPPYQPSIRGGVPGAIVKIMQWKVKFRVITNQYRFWGVYIDVGRLWNALL